MPQNAVFYFVKALQCQKLVLSLGVEINFLLT